MPQHTVRITAPFAMDRTEITVAAFWRFVEATGFRTDAERDGRGRRWVMALHEWAWVPGLRWSHPLEASRPAPDHWPAVQLSYRDAEAYCRWNGGRLPTEAEWERAARGGRDGEITAVATQPEVAAANGPDERLHAVIPEWEYVPGRDDGFAELAPVGQFSANPYGLHDMIGNAYEWTSDTFGDAPYAVSDSVDPVGLPARPLRVVRGGSWGYYPRHHRFSWRGAFESDGFRTASLGARCAYDLGQPAMRYPLWRAVRGGKHPVGFVARTTQSSVSTRPVQVSVWYPATRQPAPAMSFGGYVALYVGGAAVVGDSVSAPSADSQTVARYRASWFAASSHARVQHLAATPTAASWRAPMARGPFPIVLYAPGLGGTPLTHTITAEFLASHGFIVAMVPAQSADGGEQSYDDAGQRALVHDMQSAYASLASCAACDRQRVATMGFSFGANVALLLAQRLPTVRAVISLDGSPTFVDGIPILTRAPEFDVARATHPLLALTSDSATVADLALLRALPSKERHHLTLRGIAHHDVIGSAVIAAVVSDSLSLTADGAYQATLSTMLSFLQWAMDTVPITRSSPWNPGMAIPASIGSLHALP